MSVVTLHQASLQCAVGNRAAELRGGRVGPGWQPGNGRRRRRSASPLFFLPRAAPAHDAAPAPQAAGGIRSQNIFDVKPEASADPNYLNQTNGERNKVQPGNNAPMWRQVSGGVTGYSSLPVSEAPEAGNLIQGFVQYPGSRFTNAGEAWRQVRNNWIIPYGAALLFVTLLALAIFYFTRGPIRLHGTETGRKIERFTPFERATHWSNAIAFVTLALSGIVMAFGKFFLLPVLGSALFGYLAYVLKTVHNFVGPAVRGDHAVHDLHLHPQQLAGQGRPDLAAARRRPVRRQGAGVAPLQCRREAGVLGRRALFGQHRHRLGAVPGQAPAGLRLHARRDASRAHGACRGHAVHDGDDHGPHLHRHARHDGRLQGDARRLRRRDLGPRAPPALVRRHRCGQDPGAAQSPPEAPPEPARPATAQGTSA
jgi:hypothetical protein